MTTFLIYLTIGVVTGSIYAVAATGLVVTYTTSRIFNVAHGALGMFVAYCYYELRTAVHMPTVPAVALSVLVFGPLIGVLLDYLVMRHIQSESVVLRLVVTISLFLMLQGLAYYIWGNTIRTMPPLFASGSFQPVNGLSITYDQATTVGVAVGVAVLLWLLIQHTRVGLTMRAVVDNPQLAQMNNVRPGTITSIAWAMGTALAGLAAILAAPMLSLSVGELSLLVVSAYAAAIIGRLTSTLWTFVGGLALGILTSLLVGYLPSSSSLVQNLAQAAPFLLLFVALVVRGREQAATMSQRARREPRAMGLRGSVTLAVGAVALSIAIVPFLHGVNVVIAGAALAYAGVLFSLVLLTGMAGQISLAQFSFVGLGAVLLPHLNNHLPWAIAALLATLITALIGAVVALPALRLQGLYLALATLAFAILMDRVVLVDPHVMGNFGSGLFVRRPSIFNFTLRSQASVVPLLVAVVALYAVGILAIRRGRFGRSLAALRDAPTAAAALGLNLVRIKVIVFIVSSGMAGLMGCLYAGFLGGIGPSDFSYLLSLTAVLILAIQGISSVTGAAVGSAFYAVIYLMLPRWITNADLVSLLQPLAIGLGVVNLARFPAGAIAQQRASVEALRAWATRRWPGTLATEGPDHRPVPTPRCEGREVEVK